MDAILDGAFAAVGIRPCPRKAVARLSRPLEIHGAAWREQVKHRLIDGYGVEDIAIWLGCHVSHVQAEVARLRRRGDLALMEGLFKLVGLMRIAVSMGKPFDTVQARFMQLRRAAVEGAGPFSLSAQTDLLEIMRGRAT